MRTIPMIPTRTNRPDLNQIVHKMIALRKQGIMMTLLAVCPNSIAVLEAAVKIAELNNMPMLFAATLNQVDRDGGYTGWTPQQFVNQIDRFLNRYPGRAWLYPCLDHGGPWLKDAHTSAHLTLNETMSEVKSSLQACLQAGYALLHIDPTVDRTLSTGHSPEISMVIERTVELITYVEEQRQISGYPTVSYEVGTEEVQGGLVDWINFSQFIQGLREALHERKLMHAWPCFVVGKVGTDLATTTFDTEIARRLYQQLAPMGSLVKGHYTDWVANPTAYPQTGMGGANVGPQFTAAELDAIISLCDLETSITGLQNPSRFMIVLETAVVVSNRWQKWLSSGEIGSPFEDLTTERRKWLISTGARYVWTDHNVHASRLQLYENVKGKLSDPHGYVVDQIAEKMQDYVNAFNLKESIPLFS